MRAGIGTGHYGEKRAQTAEAMAEQIIAGELKRRRWKEAVLRARSGKGGVGGTAAGGDDDEGGWVAERLGISSRDSLNHLLYRQRQSSRK
jgi:hypothetical protein